jgi:hypothetical protein
MVCVDVKITQLRPKLNIDLPASKLYSAAAQSCPRQGPVGDWHGLIP